LAGFPMKPEEVIIPDEALSERFLAATGPGGQNVNKVATACQLRVEHRWEAPCREQLR